MIQNNNNNNNNNVEWRRFSSVTGGADSVKSYRGSQSCSDRRADLVLGVWAETLFRQTFMRRASCPGQWLWSFTDVTFKYLNFDFSCPLAAFQLTLVSDIMWRGVFRAALSLSSGFRFASLTACSSFQALAFFAQKTHIIHRLKFSGFTETLNEALVFEQPLQVSFTFCSSCSDLFC